MNLSDLFAEEDYRFHLGLRRGSPAGFFQPTSEHDTILTRRRHWLTGEPQTYSALLPQGAALLDECLALARDWQTISPAQNEQLTALASPAERCLRFGQIWEPDFLLLRPDASQQFQLVGGCVCFPSSWSLAEKVGHPLDFIHRPVPGLNAQLGRSIDLFLSKLAPGPAWLRHNWGLSRSPELNQHPSRTLPRLDESVALSEIWLRVEHQALVALPSSCGVLFGIRVTQHPLTEMKQDPVASERLIHALRTMPEAVALYKGLATARERVAALLADPA